MDRVVLPDGSVQIHVPDDDALIDDEFIANMDPTVESYDGLNVGIYCLAI